MRGRIFSWLGLGIMALTLGGLFPGVPAFYAGSPLYAITLEEEQKLGEQTVREVEARFTMVRDPLLLDYLNRIGQETLQKAGPAAVPLSFLPSQRPAIECLLGAGRAYLHYYGYPGGHGFRRRTGRIAGTRNRPRNVPSYCQTDGAGEENRPGHHGRHPGQHFCRGSPGRQRGNYQFFGHRDCPVLEIQPGR